MLFCDARTLSKLFSRLIPTPLKIDIFIGVLSHGRSASRFGCLMRSHFARTARSACPRDGAFAYTPRRFRAILGAATGAAVAALYQFIKKSVLRGTGISYGQFYASERHLSRPQKRFHAISLRARFERTRIGSRRTAALPRRGSRLVFQFSRLPFCWQNRPSKRVKLPLCRKRHL